MAYADLPEDVYHASLAVLKVKHSCAAISCDDSMAAQTNISRNLVIPERFAMPTKHLDIVLFYRSHRRRGDTQLARLKRSWSKNSGRTEDSKRRNIVVIKKRLKTVA
ncbi:hypothetical protein E2C01_027495 [Portunus trituberculatus]|uniref:Uncharacterized protein n=1 Tax=Portunus trituberculatus TaxID=210409 RepID=A0A5B7ELP3_PORTR|nr:hypothetical protein [Portunus trituberculatus]